MRKEFNSQRIFWVNQHGRRFIVLEHQYGCPDVMWKRSIEVVGRSWLGIKQNTFCVIMSLILMTTLFYKALL